MRNVLDNAVRHADSAVTVTLRESVGTAVLTVTGDVLGDGQRLFDDDGAELGLELVEALPTTTGAITASYQVTT